MENGNTNMAKNGTIVKELPVYRGKMLYNGKDYEKRTYILEVHNSRREKLKFDMSSFDGPIAHPLEVGKDYKIEFDCRSTEYNGNWYTNLTAIRIDNAEF